MKHPVFVAVIKTLWKICFKWHGLKFSYKGLMQERFLQRLQRGELPLVMRRQSLGEVVLHLAACASCNCFRVLPLGSFQSVRPFAERPKTTCAASDGEVNV